MMELDIDRLATTDGPPHETCNFFGQAQVRSDVWYCYRATCTGAAVFSLCGSNYDTKLAVYSGCGCPTVPPLACSDDDCGRGVENVQSRVTIGVTAGRQYIVRVGSFLNEQGDGRLTIGCNVETCPPDSGDCFTVHSGNGCSDATCCGETCELDQFCCDVEWDEACAGEAQGICRGSFAACVPESGSCSIPGTTPGCDDVDCCNAVCRNDPYCCLQEWDATCVNEAESACFLSCGRTTDSCLSPHALPGCSDDSCCRQVCASDPFCCDTAWDNVCADLAAQVCP